MNIVNFEYIKKKDGVTKEYIILVMEDNSENIEGIDFSKLNNDEVGQVIKLKHGYDFELNNYQNKALRDGLDFKSFVNNQSYKEMNDYYKEGLKPFIKKSYRKFIKERIKKYKPMDSLDYLIENIIKVKEKIDG
jgi:hypothetical protein